MKILSIDTSSNICTVAVLEDTKLLKEVSQNNGLTHSESLMPIIQEILNSLSISIKDIDLIVCDKGPGSFTGIRIGVATAKAFEDSLSIPSIGINSLEALAYNVKNTGVICSLIDAKKDNCYIEVFEKIDDTYLVKRNPSAESLLDIIDELKSLDYQIIFVGDGAINYKNKILEHIPNSIFCENNELSAYNLGLAGFHHFNEGSLDNLLPLYLRKPQAERMLEEKLNGNK